jgi:serine/threonine-protein kinase
LAARGITIDDVQRYTLLREAASALAFLHKHGVCVGDISPKNLLYTLAPQQSIYFIDCDAMRINDVSALTQVETPGWGVPAGEELATIYSDSYKLGLLALRLLAGDHDTTNTAHLPPTTPALLRQLISDTLTNDAQRRPLPQAWTYVLGHAIEEAQHRALSTPTAVASPDTITIAAPEVPTLRSRPPTGTISAPPQSPPYSAPPTLYSRPPTAPPPPPPTRSTAPATAILAGVGIAIVVAIAALTVVLTNHNNTNTTTNASSATSTATYPAYGSPAQAAPTQVPAKPPPDPETAAVQQLQQFADGDRAFVRDQLADRWIPQLSSKRPGVFDDGVVYNNALTLQEHMRLRQQYNAKLLWSGDWTNYDASNYWVTVVPITFNDSASALAWCTNEGFDADHCYAEVVSRTRSGRRTTAHN